MEESLDAILKKFSKLVLKEQFTEAERLVAGKIEERKVNRKKLVSAIIAAAIRIGDSEKLEELQRYTIALYYLRICMKLNRQKHLNLKIEILLADANFNLGLVFDRLGRLKEAEAAYREALRTNPTLAGAYNNLGILLDELGKSTESEETYRKALGITQDPTIYFNLAITLHRLGKLDEAEKTYREALKINPKYEKAYNNLGVIFLDSGRLNEAKKAFKNALKINPRLAEPYFNLGLTLRKLGRSKKSEEFYREALRINSQDAEAYNSLGNVLSDQGRLDEAEAAYKEALKINPKLAEAHFNLGILLFRTNRFIEAASSLSISINLFAEKKRKEDLVRARAYSSWIDGFGSWQKGNLEKGEKSYALASKLFAKIGERDLASVLVLIAKQLEIDRGYLGYLRSDNIVELKKGILLLYGRIRKSTRDFRKIPLAEMEILNAKVTCIQVLKATLLFEPIEQRQLEGAKEIFSRYQFLHAYEGANAIDTFKLYLNTFCPAKNLKGIQRYQEKKLFRKLNPAIGLDGIVTQHFAKLVADRLKPELYSAVAEPIIKEQRKTRKVITQKIGRIQARLESIHVTLLGIEQEIAIKRVSYSEFEIIFPVPYGVYKIHIPAGEITTRDIVNIKTEIFRREFQIGRQTLQITPSKRFHELFWKGYGME